MNRYIVTKDYLLARDCHIYAQKQKDDGVHYFIRRNNTKKMAVVYPVKVAYTEFAVGHICQTLNVDVAPYAANCAQVLKEAKRKAKVLDEFPQQGDN